MHYRWTHLESSVLKIHEKTTSGHCSSSNVRAGHVINSPGGLPAPPATPGGPGEPLAWKNRNFHEIQLNRGDVHFRCSAIYKDLWSDRPPHIKASIDIDFCFFVRQSTLNFLIGIEGIEWIAQKMNEKSVKSRPSAQIQGILHKLSPISWNHTIYRLVFF